jgi:hypothetical protein
MNLDLLFDNLTNPALLFSLLGIATKIESDLEIQQYIQVYFFVFTFYLWVLRRARSNTVIFTHGIIWAVHLGVQ